MIVDQLTEDEWERLGRIRVDALRTDPDAFGSSLAREEGFKEMHWRMRLRSSPWFVARDEGVDVGLVCVIQEPGADETERHVVSFWVRPEARRRGTGRALLGAAAAWAAADGAARLTLWQMRGNDAAAATFRAAGFAPTGDTMPLPRDPSRTEERWALELGGAA
ncbi:GNAT family N-acetyltransferase [Actinotalea ferrariae]|uniref:GNAT family N-acetyltransferase n=1 Tax=Actinotalea ferrariae TaxID=1386098 RepID=UPI001C8B141D|nr:GNAT family N-acetyltransferase [Actinotalea ferrariae]MBX9245084.1 GNAT family N-acetyltransferase [Actinotalea ferrariae]